MSKPTTIKVIDENSPLFGKEAVVEMIHYGVEMNESSIIYAKFNGDDTITPIQRGCVEVIHIHDYDNHIEVNGKISLKAYNLICKQVTKIPYIQTCGGWTGNQAVIHVKCEIGRASNVLPAIQEIAAKHGLNARKPKVEL